MMSIETVLHRKIGNFYLVREIGSGGISDVHLGINPRSREKRAFKILRKCASAGSSTYEHFLREIDVVRDLTHPGIVKIIDNGILDDCLFYSTEFMPGGNLCRLLERGRMELSAALRLFAAICDAMTYAHEQGVAHGDLKPSNVLLSAAGEPVLSDFGMDRTPDFKRTPITRSGNILGAIAYLAPEQRFSSQIANRRADVFALGAILYQMLMGFPPLGNFPMPMEAQPDFPEYLQSLLKNCLAPEPGCRFEHAGLLRTELEKRLGQPTSKTIEFKLTVLPSPWTSPNEAAVPPTKIDRIESWFRVLRAGTARERLAIVREMVEAMTAAEAKTIVKLYAEEEDRVRWGLIRVLGELRIEAATPLILIDLNCSFCSECAIEALGKIGSYEAFNPIREFAANHPESAVIAMLPMARTGKKRAIQVLEQYLSHETAVLRQAAARALGSIELAESLILLKEHLCIESDEKVRSTLVQAVHGLQRVLCPALKTVIPSVA
jgi:hypothetical protein